MQHFLTRPFTSPPASKLHLKTRAILRHECGDSDTSLKNSRKMKVSLPFLHVNLPRTQPCLLLAPPFPQVSTWPLPSGKLLPCLNPSVSVFNDFPLSFIALTSSCHPSECSLQRRTTSVLCLVLWPIQVALVLEFACLCLAVFSKVADLHPHVHAHSHHLEALGN